MITPKFVYNPGGGAVTLTPTYPATGKVPVDALAATRADSITSDGHRQTVVERIDSIKPLVFPYIPEADLAAWSSFLSYALAGGPFDYYPDHTSGTHTSYELSDEGWQPQRVGRGLYSFTINLRLYVA